MFLLINYQHLEFGFSLGDRYDKKHFFQNCHKYKDELRVLLDESLTGGGFDFVPVSGAHGDRDARARNLTWAEWLEMPAKERVRIRILLPKNEILQSSTAQLRNRIARAFNTLYPLVLLATSDDPLPVIQKYLEIDPPPPVPPVNAEYTLAQCARETNLEETMLRRWVGAIEHKRQAVLYGPPGTGKTFIAEHMAKHLIGGGDGFWELVQFHPAYAYEDFIQGIRPTTRTDGGLAYSLEPGRFLEFCEKAKSRTGCCVLLVDEINRANLARVFGELMYLLEYRDSEVPLAGGGTLRIPRNVRLIGTMNTADRSIALVDHALRRRFAFIALYPNYEILRRYHQETGFSVEPLIKVLTHLNNRIDDRHYAVGVTFFLHQDLAERISDIWQMEIEPYLEEYFFDQAERVEEFRWEQVRGQIL